MNRVVVLGVALFFGMVGIALVGGEHKAQAGLFGGHGGCDGGSDCGGCRGRKHNRGGDCCAPAHDSCSCSDSCGGRKHRDRCSGRDRCHGRDRCNGRNRCNGDRGCNGGCHGGYAGGEVMAGKGGEGAIQGPVQGPTK